jgi:hypothetical protein
MSRDYLNKKAMYSFNNDRTNPVTRSEPLDLTLLSIKFGFAGITAIIMMSLILFFIISWPWLSSQFF